MFSYIENIALGKQTFQSSDFSKAGHPSGPSNKAVDGITNQSVYKGKSCSHTKNDTNAWWTVDLGHFYEITSVKIYNRKSHGRYFVQSIKICQFKAIVSAIFYALLWDQSKFSTEHAQPC